MEIVLTPKNYDEIMSLINEIEHISFLQGKHNEDEDFCAELEKDIMKRKGRIKRIFYGCVNIKHKQREKKHSEHQTIN